MKRWPPVTTNDLPERILVQSKTALKPAGYRISELITREKLGFKDFTMSEEKWLLEEMEDIGCYNLLELSFIIAKKEGKCNDLREYYHYVKEGKHKKTEQNSVVYPCGDSTTTMLLFMFGIPPLLGYYFEKAWNFGRWIRYKYTIYKISNTKKIIHRF